MLDMRKAPLLYGLFVFLFVAMVAPGYGEDKPPYPILDSGVWATNLSLPTPKVYWLDSNRVLFLGSEDFTYKTQKIPVISIWEIGKGVTLYKKNAMIQCFRSGILWYTQRNAPPQPWIQMRGPLGQEQPYDKPPGNFVYPDSIINCSYLDAQQFRERERNGRPLLPNHGYLDRGSSAKIDAMKNQPVVYHRSGNAKAIPLPFKSRDVEPLAYIQFKNAYFFVGDYFDQVRGINVSPWPKGLAQPLWWLTPRGEITQITVPPNAFGRGSAADFVPTIKGIFVAAGGDISETNSGDAGGYLFRDGKMGKVIDGWVFGAAVSPDGWRVAFSHAPNGVSDLANEKNRRTLKMIDFCK